MTGAQICAARRCSNIVPPKGTEGGPPKLYCSESCAKAESKARRNDRKAPAPMREAIGICFRPGCDRPRRDPPKLGPAPIYCSRRCVDMNRNHGRQAFLLARGPLEQVRVCLYCERDFTVILPSTKKYCCRVCRNTATNRDKGVIPMADHLLRVREKAEESRQAWTCELPGCSAVMLSPLGNPKRPRWYCSAEHYAEHRRVDGALWTPAADIADRDMRSGARRVKAAGFGAAIELFSNLEILERDGWRCQICRCKTPQHLRGSKAQNAPEVDHKIPVNRGGAHTRENCWCLCHRCNHRKGNKLLKDLEPWGNNPGLFDSIDGEG